MPYTRFTHEDGLCSALDELLGAARVPGAVIAAARGAGPVALLAYGADAGGASLDSQTLFPVASVTKLATALAVLRLADAGLLEVADPLAAHVPEAAAAHPGVTVAGLLCHTAGMPLDLASAEAPYAPGLSWPALAQACLAAAPATAPGQRVQYSNPGYGLLAVLVERLSGLAFAEALGKLVLEPLAIEGYLGQEPPRPPARLDDVRGEHAGGPLEPFNSPFWRSLALPWAGLVTTAGGALALVRAFLGEPAGFLREATRVTAIQSHTGSLGGGFVAPMIWEPCPWGLGPELRGAKQPHWGPPGAPGSFGHSGASGCLAWADPESDTAWAILGARAADSGWLLRRGGALSTAITAAL